MHQFKGGQRAKKDNLQKWDEDERITILSSLSSQ